MSGPREAVGIELRTDRSSAMALAQVAYGRFADVISALGPDDWDRPTDCVGWTVRHLVGHVVGEMRSCASMRRFAIEQIEVKRRVKSRGGNATDQMTAIQIEVTSGLSHAELVAECRRLIGPAVAGRRRYPAAVRRLKFSVDFGSARERWTLGYLMDTILTRDIWMHRIDLCRAIGVEPLLTPDHDGRIVAGVVTEWARRHGADYSLVLGGSAGGTFGQEPGPGVESLELDDVEFCRILSGRGEGPGLLSVPVPF